MSNTYTQFQILRGDSASNAAYVGRPGELTADMENNILRLHDGTTPGGTIIGSGSSGGGGGATFPYTGNAVITGSLWVSGSYNGLSGITGSFSGSLLGTASYAETTITASYISGGIYIPEGLIITGSTYITGTLEVTNGITGSLLGTASRAIIAENVDVLSGGSTTGLGVYSGSFSGSFFGDLIGGGGGFPFSGSAVITGSLLISSSGIYLSGSGLTGSVLGTSSWANNSISASHAIFAVSSSRSISTEKIDVLSGGSTTGLGIYSGSFYGTASHAITASYALNASTGGGGFPFSGSAVITGSLLISSSGLNLIGAGATGSFTGSLIGTASRSISTEKIDVLSGGSTTGLGIYSGSFYGTASHAITASYALNAGTGGSGFPFSGSAVITGSLLISSSGLYLSGSGVTGSLLGTASNAVSASYSFTAAQVDVISGGSTTGLGVYSGSFSGSFFGNLTGYGSGFPYSGSAVITGSLLISSSGLYLSGSGLTGSVLGTASRAISASRADSSEKVDVLSGGSTTGLGIYSGSFFGTSSWAISASYVVNSGTGTVGPGTINSIALFSSSTAISSSNIFQSSSNVGIGTTIPSTKLHVVGGSARVDNVGGTLILNDTTSGTDAATSNYISFQRAGTEKAWVGFGDATNGLVRLQNTIGTVRVAASGEVQLWSANSQTVTVDSSNRVGIGTTSPASLLDIKYKDGSTNLYRATDGGGQYRWRVDQSFEMLLTNGSGTDIVKIGQTEHYFNVGNVGIGTNSPNTKLHIYTASVAADTNFIKVQMPSWSTSTNYLKNIIWSDGSDVGAIGMKYDGSKVNMHFHSFYNGGYTTSASVMMVINGNGNVGIGTTNPANTLQVQGNVSASSYTSSISNAVGYFGTSSWSVSASRGVTTEKVDVLSGGSTTGLGTYSGSFYGTSMIVSGGQAYTIRYDVGNQATTYTVNWNNGNHQSVNLTANTQLSFSNGQPGGAYSLELRPTGTYSASWPSSVKWPSNSEPTQTKSSTKKDIFTFYYDGTVYNGQVFGFDYALS